MARCAHNVRTPNVTSAPRRHRFTTAPPPTTAAAPPPPIIATAPPPPPHRRRTATAAPLPLPTRDSHGRDQGGGEVGDVELDAGERARQQLEPHLQRA
eukprot:5608978-Prymnesium_polylepis.2